jgi:hypothetical protein
VKVKSGIAFVCFFASCTVASAFEISTHEKLTAEAILRSALTTNPSLLSNLGLTVLGEGTYPNSDNTLRTANETIVYGAKFEDTAFAAGAVERVFNHFFDPQFNARLARALFYVSAYDMPSFPSPINTSEALMASACL